MWWGACLKRDCCLQRSGKASWDFTLTNGNDNIPSCWEFPCKMWFSFAWEDNEMLAGKSLMEKSWEQMGDFPAVLDYRRIFSSHLTIKYGPPKYGPPKWIGRVFSGKNMVLGLFLQYLFGGNDDILPYRQQQKWRIYRDRRGRRSWWLCRMWWTVPWGFPMGYEHGTLRKNVDKKRLGKI